MSKNTPAGKLNLQRVNILPAVASVQELASVRDIVAALRTITDLSEILPREDILAFLEQLAKEDALADEVAFSRQFLEYIVQYSVSVDKRKIVSCIRERKGEATADKAHGGERTHL